jgi:hypothetical protein
MVSSRAQQGPAGAPLIDLGVPVMAATWRGGIEGQVVRFRTANVSLKRQRANPYDDRAPWHFEGGTLSIATLDPNGGFLFLTVNAFNGDALGTLRGRRRHGNVQQEVPPPSPLLLRTFTPTIQSPSRLLLSDPDDRENRAELMADLRGRAREHRQTLAPLRGVSTGIGSFAHVLTLYQCVEIARDHCDVIDVVPDPEGQDIWMPAAASPKGRASLRGVDVNR